MSFDQFQIEGVGGRQKQLNTLVDKSFDAEMAVGS